jgi:hypothetical protein
MLPGAHNTYGENLVGGQAPGVRSPSAPGSTAAEIYEFGERLEALTQDTPAWGSPAATRARVEARAALEQAEELRRVIEELGRELRGEVP